MTEVIDRRYRAGHRIRRGDRCYQLIPEILENYVTPHDVGTAVVGVALHSAEIGESVNVRICGWLEV